MMKRFLLKFFAAFIFFLVACSDEGSHNAHDGSTEEDNAHALNSSSSAGNPMPRIIYLLDQLDLYNGVSGYSSIDWYEVRDTAFGHDSHMLWKWDSVYYSPSPNWQKEVTKNCGGLCGVTSEFHAEYDYEYFTGLGFEIPEKLKESEGICISMLSSARPRPFLELHFEEEIEKTIKDNNVPKVYVYDAFIQPEIVCYKWEEFFMSSEGYAGDVTELPVEMVKKAKTLEIRLYSNVGSNRINVMGVGTYRDVPRETFDLEGWATAMEELNSLTDPLLYVESEGDTICGDIFCRYETVKGTDMYYVGIRGVPDRDFDQIGDWFVFDDTSKSAIIKSPISRYIKGNLIKDNMYELYIPDSYVVDSCYGFCGSYQIGEAGSEVGFAFPFGFVGYDGEQYHIDTVDETALLDGLCFVYMSDAEISLQLVPGKQSITLPKAPKGNIVDVKWTDFKDGKNAAKALNAMKFIFKGSAGDTGRFNLTSAGHLGTCQGLPAYDERGFAIHAPEYVVPDFENDFIWGATDSLERVITGYDDGSKTSGYWYEFNDLNKGGKSKIIYPSDYDVDENGRLVKPALGSLRGTVVVDSSSEKPFVGLAFDLAGKDRKGTDYYGDLCLAYTATVPFEVELVPEDSTETFGDTTWVYRMAPMLTPGTDYTQSFKRYVGDEVYDDAYNLWERVATIRLRFTQSGEFDIRAIGTKDCWRY